MDYIYIFLFWLFGLLLVVARARERCGSTAINLYLFFADGHPRKGEGGGATGR